MMYERDGGRSSRFCPYCGKEVSADASVCPHCGKKLEVGAAPAEKQTPNRVSGLEVAGVSLGVIGSAITIVAGMSMASTDMAGGGVGVICLGVFLFGAPVLLFFWRTQHTG